MIKSIAAIGNKETNTDKEKLQHAFLVYMGLLMSGGGLLWGIGHRSLKRVGSREFHLRAFPLAICVAAAGNS